MFHLEFPEAMVTGASPEALVRLEGARSRCGPSPGRAGAAPRAEEDAALEAELRHDPKERAEHVMLVDLGRNDVGRVAATGTVRVNELMVVERYSHVMHLVSNIAGKRAAGMRAADVLRAAFPAGTLSGAPRSAPWRSSRSSSRSRRGIYGGAVGYVSYTGQPRPGHRHPHAGHAGRHDLRAGRRRHRRRQRAGGGARGVREQGARRAERGRDRAAGWSRPTAERGR